MTYPHGLITWVDLATTDVEAARVFYSELLGWESEDVPTPMGVPYTFFRKDGKLVAGMGPQPPEVAAAGVPSLWQTYVSVDSVDEVVAKVESAGGTVHMPPMDVMAQGRMALIADPTGAVLGLWQPGEHKGAELFNAPGSLSWSELQTRDLEAALPFYAEVLAWRWEDGPDPSYKVANVDAKEGPDKSTAGALTMPETVPDEIPSAWSAYLAVEDCDAAVAKVQELGGSVVFGPMEAGPMRFAGIMDPTGAYIVLGAYMTSEPSDAS